MHTRSLSLVRTVLLAAALVGVGTAAVSGLRAWHHHEATEALVGLWSKTPSSSKDGDPVRFYYFHEGEIGLYRYGKVGLNTTNSFDWHVDGGALALTYRKSGAAVTLPFRIERVGDHDELVVTHDPREPRAAEARYVRLGGGMAAGAAPDLFDDDRAPVSGTHPIAGRLWIDAQRYATGGMGFSLWQLKDAAIDGRGVGWHHVGDFDDWSTEALTFRASTVRGSDSPSDDVAHITGALDLDFTLRGEHAVTSLAVIGAGKERRLVLGEDPRDYWQQHSYKDGGPAFGVFARLRDATSSLHAPSSSQ